MSEPGKQDEKLSINHDRLIASEEASEEGTTTVKASAEHLDNSGKFWTK